MDQHPLESLQESHSDIRLSALPLRPGLWLDLEGGVLFHEQQEIFLTAREVNVLHILVRAMHTSRGYLPASILAHRLQLSEAFDAEHCIEQTISVLRRKLGEIPHRPRILRGRRGLGYRLCPESAMLSIPTSP